MLSLSISLQTLEPLTFTFDPGNEKYKPPAPVRFYRLPSLARTSLIGDSEEYLVMLHYTPSDHV